MAAPVVQNLDDIIAELNPAYSQQEGLVNTQRAGLGAKYDGQRAGLNAEKAQGFNAINNQATARGMSFSGVPIDEQSTYLSTKFLPGMQNLNTQQNTEDLTLQSALASINSEKRLRALDTRSNQQNSLEKYLAEERARAFEAEQNRLTRAQQTSMAAQARADQGNEDIQIVKNKAGGWQVLVNGKASNQYDLASAAQMTGKSVLSLLQNGSESDKKAYNAYTKNQDLAALKRGTGAFYLGGAFNG